MRKSGAVITGLWLALLVVANTAAGADARRQLDDFAAGLKTLSARFEQLTRDESGLLIDATEGTFFFSAPDRFRWDYLEPFPQLLLADGQRLWHYDEALEQVTVSAQPEPGDSPVMVLTNPDLLERFYAIVPGDDPDVLELRPHSEEGDFESARLYFHGGAPDRLELVDTFGQRTMLRWSEIERNPVIDETLFRFEVPDGVDVLEGL